jgi:predicted NUDIX family NTP pyrophosphohydrolase
MAKQSAGILAYRFTSGMLEVFLVHPGGPFYAKKDLGVWSVPKGEFTSRDALTEARREFFEETGTQIAGEFIELKVIRQKGGKYVYVWAVEADLDAETIVSNTFELEFPPRSGFMRTYAEVDRAGWFDIETARTKILASQAPLLSDLETHLG